ncbi:hypothetical protein K491DRAFT_674756 [Lophiostoma macrostomum CBS 122681]|uniref:Uncharacterized protein n=1 Tax=Lophiostoma macrostomum CBS 122681 TaxID=1314788 RepID=A0A6A6TPK9_9PLEO|nr:hypothetical protein K491DRAFT_674756 [Lophiostoma macrostomum CBS 122681]
MDIGIRDARKSGLFPKSCSSPFMAAAAKTRLLLARWHQSIKPRFLRSVLFKRHFRMVAPALLSRFRLSKGCLEMWKTYHMTVSLKSRLRPQMMMPDSLIHGDGCSSICITSSKSTHWPSSSVGNPSFTPNPLADYDMFAAPRSRANIRSWVCLHVDLVSGINFEKSSGHSI